jgi:hypothetical protein
LGRLGGRFLEDIFVAGWRGEKRGLTGVLQGVLAKCVVLLWCFCGVDVVECVAVVVIKPRDFGLRKIRHIFEIYFGLFLAVSAMICRLSPKVW